MLTENDSGPSAESSGEAKVPREGFHQERGFYPTPRCKERLKINLKNAIRAQLPQTLKFA